MKTFEELKSKEKVEEIKPYFTFCLTDGKNRRKEKDTPSLEFELDGDWLAIYYLNVKNYHPSDSPDDSYSYKLLCAQDLRDYRHIMPLINRITLLLADHLIRANQEINGILDENELIKKPF